MTSPLLIGLAVLLFIFIIGFFTGALTGSNMETRARVARRNDQPGAGQFHHLSRPEPLPDDPPGESAAPPSADPDSDDQPS